MDNYQIRGDNIDRLYVTRKGGESELTSIEDCVDATIPELEEYFLKRLIIAVSNWNVNRNHLRTNKKTTKQTKNIENKKVEKKLY